MKNFLLIIFFTLVTFSSNLQGSELMSLLEEHLKKEFGFEEVYIDTIKTSKDVYFVPDKINIENFSGKYINITLIHDDKIIDGKAEIRAFKKVPVSKTGLEKGRKITEEDIVESLMEYSKLPKGTILDKSLIIGKTLKVSMKTNSVFLENKLIAIKKGQDVVLKVGNKNLNIVMVGKALEDGFIGKQIRILNTQSNKVVKGVVTDENVVIMPF